VTVWPLVGTFLAAALLFASLIDVVERRRRSAHRRRASHALWLEIDEKSFGMRYGEHGLWGMYLPETVPHRPAASRSNGAQGH
jgi:hypothetical protein